jgi:hypothetical protein
MSKTTTKKTATRKTAKAPEARDASTLSSNGKPLSMLGAAVKVFSGKELSCKEAIELMAKRKLWTSPGGKTPHATLAAAIIREIAVKGKESRFRKVRPGRFTAVG